MIWLAVTPLAVMAFLAGLLVRFGKICPMCNGLGCNDAMGHTPYVIEKVWTPPAPPTDPAA